MAIAVQNPAGTRAGPASAPPIYVLVAIALAGCLLAVFSIALAVREGVPDIQIALLEWISLP